MFDDEPVAREAVATPAPTRRRGGSRRPPTQARDARPSESDAPAPAPRDLPTALATAGIVAVVALLAFSLGRFWTALLASAVMGLAALELSHGLVASGRRLAMPLALVAVAATPIAAQHYGLAALPLIAFLVVVFTLLWFLWEVSPGRPAGGVATTLLVFCYVGLLGGYAGLLLQARDGIGLLLGAVLPVIAYDVFGFFVGSQFGKTPVAPRISPNKTVEGTIAGVLGAIVVAWLVVGQIAPWNGTRAFVLGCLVAVGAFFGDLAESMLKRDLGVKDFGSLLPGHGGVLDRFDGLLLALPITYYFALHINQIF